MSQQLRNEPAGQPNPLATVVIPIKNPGRTIFRIVAALKRQTITNFDVLVIDSGSPANTLVEMSQAFDTRFSFIEIEPTDFGHGRTRNLGASLAKGEYVVFLTHDALPKHDKWLEELLKTISKDTKIGASFGPHVAYEEHSRFTARDLDRHFNNFSARGTAFIEDVNRWSTDQSYRQNLHFLSNNNAAYRKSTLSSIPFPDVEFSEDQAWASAALEMGYGIHYEPEAIVYHSHQFSSMQMFKRGLDEARSLNRLFGYQIEKSPFTVIKNAAIISREDFLFWFANRKQISFSEVAVRIFGLFLSRLGYYFGGKNSARIDRAFGHMSLDNDLRTGKRTGDFKRP
jgi:rhamnosyltransferase